MIGWVVFAFILFVDHPKLNTISDCLYTFGDRYLLVDDTTSYIPRLLTVSLASSVVYFILVCRVRQYFIRFLLSYKGWLCKKKIFFLYLHNHPLYERRNLMKYCRTRHTSIKYTTDDANDTVNNRGIYDVVSSSSKYRSPNVYR